MELVGAAGLRAVLHLKWPEPVAVVPSIFSKDANSVEAFPLKLKTSRIYSSSSPYTIRNHVSLHCANKHQCLESNKPS